EPDRDPLPAHQRPLRSHAGRGSASRRHPRCRSARRPTRRPRMEDILQDIDRVTASLIVTVDPAVAEHIRSDPSWSQIEAVQLGRVFLSPRLPYGWIDAPPSLHRLKRAAWVGAPA